MIKKSSFRRFYFSCVPGCQLGLSKTFEAVPETDRHSSGKPKLLFFQPKNRTEEDETERFLSAHYWTECKWSYLARWEWTCGEYDLVMQSGNLLGVAATSHELETYVLGSLGPEDWSKDNRLIYRFPFISMRETRLDRSNTIRHDKIQWTKLESILNISWILNCSMIILNLVLINSSTLPLLNLRSMLTPVKLTGSDLIIAVKDFLQNCSHGFLSFIWHPNDEALHTHRVIYEKTTPQLSARSFRSYIEREKNDDRDDNGHYVQCEVLRSTGFPVEYTEIALTKLVDPNMVAPRCLHDYQWELASIIRCWIESPVRDVHLQVQLLSAPSGGADDRDDDQNDP